MPKTQLPMNANPTINRSSLVRELPVHGPIHDPISSIVTVNEESRR
jgi:hypothetical protein